MENLSGLVVKVEGESKGIEDATKLTEEDKDSAAASESESTAKKLESPSTVRFESVEVKREKMEREKETDGRDIEIIDEEVRAGEKRRRTTSKSPDRKRTPQQQGKRKSSERSLVCAIADVKVFDEVSRRWVASGRSGGGGVSKVRIWHQLTNNTFRVVGRTVVDDQLVISCPVTRDLEYHQTRSVFHQWLDRKRWYGLEFGSTEDAAAFAIAMFDVLEILNSQRDPPAQAPPPPPLGVLSSTVGPHSLPPAQGHHHTRRCEYCGKEDEDDMSQQQQPEAPPSPNTGSPSREPTVAEVSAATAFMDSVSRARRCAARIQEMTMAADDLWDRIGGGTSGAPHSPTMGQRQWLGAEGDENVDMERLEAAIEAKVKKEVQKMKLEIIEEIKMELSWW